MTQAIQLALFEQTNKEVKELLISKGHDYAGEDVLQNFKQLHQLLLILKIDMTRIEGVHMFYILLKIQRLSNLLFSNKTAKNESVQDTVKDMRNYTDLLNCTLVELDELIPSTKAPE